MIFGILACVLFGLTYFPQLIRSYKRKSVGDISIWSWLLQVVAYCCGIMYGLYLHQLTLLLGYSWGLLCTIAFVIMYFVYRKK